MGASTCIFKQLNFKANMGFENNTDMLRFYPSSVVLSCRVHMELHLICLYQSMGIDPDATAVCTARTLYWKLVRKQPQKYACTLCVESLGMLGQKKKVSNLEAQGKRQKIKKPALDLARVIWCLARNYERKIIYTQPFSQPFLQSYFKWMIFLQNNL